LGLTQAELRVTVAVLETKFGHCRVSDLSKNQLHSYIFSKILAPERVLFSCESLSMTLAVI
jgi:hypothetical protein